MLLKKVFNILILSAIVLGCSSVNSAGDKTKLARMNWSDKNYEVLNNFITDYGIGGKKLRC